MLVYRADWNEPRPTYKWDNGGVRREGNYRPTDQDRPPNPIQLSGSKPAQLWVYYYSGLFVEKNMT